MDLILIIKLWLLIFPVVAPVLFFRPARPIVAVRARTGVLLFRRALVRPVSLMFLGRSCIWVFPAVLVSVRGSSNCNGSACVRVCSVGERCCFPDRCCSSAIVFAYSFNIVATIAVVFAIIITVAGCFFPPCCCQLFGSVRGKAVAVAGACFSRVKDPRASWCRHGRRGCGCGCRGLRAHTVGC